MTDKLIKIAIMWATSAALLYLGGAFATANFTPMEWDSLIRAAIGLMWPILAAASVMTVLLG